MALLAGRWARDLQRIITPPHFPTKMYHLLTGCELDGFAKLLLGSLAKDFHADSRKPTMEGKGK